MAILNVAGKTAGKLDVMLIAIFFRRWMNEVPPDPSELATKVPEKWRKGWSAQTHSNYPRKLADGADPRWDPVDEIRDCWLGCLDYPGRLFVDDAVSCLIEIGKKDLADDLRRRYESLVRIAIIYMAEYELCMMKGLCWEPYTKSFTPSDGDRLILRSMPGYMITKKLDGSEIRQPMNQFLAPDGDPMLTEANSFCRLLDRTVAILSPFAESGPKKKAEHLQECFVRAYWLVLRVTNGVIPSNKTDWNKLLSVLKKDYQDDLRKAFKKTPTSDTLRKYVTQSHKYALNNTKNHGNSVENESSKNPKI